MAKLNEKIFKTKKIVGGLIVVLFIVIGFQTVVDSLFSGLTGLETGGGQ